MERKVTEALDSIARAGLRSPKIVTLMITNGCNLSCLHCWPESRPCDTTLPVPTDTLKRVIGECALLGVEEVCLTGGEPLTHPDWFEILSFACRQPGLKRVRLQTNATLLTEVEVRALRSVSFMGLSIQASLEGATPETHDRVRGPGNFERAFQGLKLLAEAGLGKQTQVEFTEMEHNFMELPRLLELLDKLGIGSLVSGTLVLGGRAARTDQLGPPTPSQYRELLDLYHSDPQFRSRYKKLGNIAALEWLRGRSYPASECCICIETPYISADGKMYPCLMLPIEKYAADGVHNRPLDEVLMEAVSFWAELPALNRRRSVELAPCKKCPGRLHCAGGCMGRAYAATGDPMNVEDRCVLRKSVYSWKVSSTPIHKENDPSSPTRT
ncbi:MAG: radical SAM protein [Desulfobacterales bacterium]|nr:radical SAM protein [Desulfobacterales bacterium]MBL7225813.1 radical SAM protein [Desulfobacteraceae bacterium]